MRPDAYVRFGRQRTFEPNGALGFGEAPFFVPAIFGVWGGLSIFKKTGTA
jgi:hypothetical protein